MNTFQKIWDFTKSRHSSMIKSLVFSFIRSVFGITQIFAVILAIQVVMGEAPVQKSIIWILVLTLVCIIGNFITSYIEQTSTLKTGFFTVSDKRIEIGQKLRQLPLGFFNLEKNKNITATLTSTLSGVENAMAMVMIGIIAGLFNSIAMFIFMLFYDWRIALIGCVGMVVYLMIVHWQMKISRRNAPRLQQAQDRLSHATLTFLQGIKVIKTCDYQQNDEDLNRYIQESCDANINLTKVSMPSQYLAQLSIAFFESIIFVSALYFYFVKQDISLIQVMILIIFSFVCYASLNQAGSMLSMIGLLDVGMNEVAKFDNAKPLDVKEPLQHPTDHNIVLEHVSFAYDDHEVLKDISTVMKENTSTAIIGPSGSGKTTLCYLIARFRDVSDGTISIGGVDIRHMDYEELMQQMSMVFQNVYLFEDSILNNIRFAKPEASLEEVREAAKKARCDDFVMALENGYDTMVEEGGKNLSGGEKQRISIARAILKDAPIIILDEATSALDVENEHEIMDAIDVLTQNKTVIMIAHRMETVKNADHIIAINDGGIVQEGTHEELIVQDGLYRDFIETKQKAQDWKL